MTGEGSIVHDDGKVTLWLEGYDTHPVGAFAASTSA